jgi:uncharacterized membrane protein YhaH (DUF805 family)
VAVIIDNVLGIIAIQPLFSLAVLLPTIAVSVRRLHDIGMSGWTVIIAIPVIGPAIMLIVWYCTKGTAGPNRFGPDPLGA